MIARWVNELWLLSGRKHHREFCGQIGNIEGVQQGILMDYVSLNKNTLFGQDHHFERIKSYADYRELVPLISRYDDLEHYIEKIGRGEKNVLSGDAVLFFESTSGSTAGPKLIPYNQRLKDEFQKGIAIWMHELKKQFPSAFFGKSYWSLSPPLKERYRTFGGIQVGTASDDEYFNTFSRWLIGLVMAVDRTVLVHRNARDFYLETCIQLLQAENLSFISVWSPGFFIQLDDFIRKEFDVIIAGIQDAKRKKALIKQSGFNWEVAFPKLRVISCWTEAHASLWKPQLLEKTGNICIQPKGLMSTEGIISLPTANGNALAYTIHFYEFMDVDDDSIHLAHELELNRRYEVIITTGGGLYRYRTGDVVLVDNITPYPILKFEGRRGVVSDLVGEKLDQLFIQQVFDSVLKNKLRIKALLIQPIKTDQSAYYQLDVFSDEEVNIDSVVNEVNGNLCRNPYYRQALDLGQLRPLIARKQSMESLNLYMSKYARQRNIKDGDAKLPVLLPVNFDTGN